MSGLAYLSRKELAAALDMSESTVDAMVRRGVILGWVVGGGR